MNKKIISLILMSTVITSTSLTAFATPASASTSYNKESSINSSVNTFSTQTLIDEIQPYIVVDNNGKIGLSSSIPDELHDKYDLNLLEKRFTTLNKQVTDGTIVINKDLTITETKSKNNRLLRSSSDGNILSHSDDFRRTYWWGQSLGYCPKCTKKIQSELRKGVRTLNFLGLTGGGFGTAIPAYYFDKLQSDIEDAKTDNGVVIDLNYTMVYNCYGR